MTILIALLVLAVLFGAGSILKGLAWGLLIVGLLVAVAVFYGYRKVARR